MAMVTLTIDGIKVEIEDRTPLIEAARIAGIEIPTLCYFKGMEPYGVCRICICEVKIGKRIRIVTACNYPVSNGIEVFTKSDRVIKNRRVNIELLLARCPTVEVVAKLAQEYGVDPDKVRFEVSAEKCILCGLCARMCSDVVGANIISFESRGPDRKVTLPFDEEIPEKCISCGACAFVCPTGYVSIEDTDGYKIRPSELMFAGPKTAIYVTSMQAVPNVAVIDKDTCIHFKTGYCKLCEAACEAKAIDYEQEEKKFDLNVGAIILSPGYETFDATAKQELGYDRYPNVVTALQFERILSASGPFQGRILRPFDNKKPEKIAFIQCVGSREEDRDYCSAVCCMYATKEAIITKEHEKDIKCDIFFMDLRAFGKGYEEYYQRAKKLGINYIRCRVPSIEEIPQTRNLIIKYITEDDKKESAEYDLVILSIGMQPPKSADELKRVFGLASNEYGFCETHLFTPVNPSKEGIFAAGPFTAPKDIPETVTQASAAAAKASALLADVRNQLITKKEFPPEIDVSNQEPRIGVFVCHCGKNIGGVINVKEVVKYANALPDVAFAYDYLYACSVDSGENIKKMIRDHNLNRVVVASCTPRTHEPLFRSIIREAGLNPYLFEMANIRDQNTWVHTHEPEAALKKAKDLVRMAVAKARLTEPLQKRTLEISHDALVIGGGLAGMTAALELASQGFKTHLVEKEKDLGGNLRKLRFLLNGENPQEKLSELINSVKINKGIHLYTGSEITKVEGSIGNFTTTIKTNGGCQEINHGAIIVAIGASEYKPTEYLYGKSSNVLTQLELEERISNGGAKEFIGPEKSVVMIQCVGGRNSERNYCSRLCCNNAVKNALKIKEISPEANVYILYKDMMTYGFSESYYTKARQAGVIFIRYDEDHKPNVSESGTSLIVRCFDPVSQRNLVIESDLVVLSPAIIPAQDSKNLSQMLKVPLTQDGFFLEAHIKLRPVDFATDGIFVSGLAHYAKPIDESIIQAGACASRACTILAKDHLELEANISFVVDEYCDGCAYCIEPCPYKALTLIEYMKDGAIKKTVELNESLCKGCGTCQATCPKKGIFVKGFKIEQILAQIEAALQHTEH